MNYFQNKKIEEHFKNNNVGTDIDITEQSIREMLILSGYTTSEIAALLFTVMRNILLYEKNLEMFHEAGIEVNQLNTEVVTEIQKLLIKEYLNGLNDANLTTRA